MSASSVKDVSMLQIRMMEPFPVEEVMKFLEGKRIITVEQNYSGQLADLLREKTGLETSSRIVKFNGRPIAFEEMVEVLSRKELKEREVLTYA